MKLARVGAIAVAILPAGRWREPRKPTSDMLHLEGLPGAGNVHCDCGHTWVGECLAPDLTDP